jgi:hypothetical protein
MPKSMMVDENGSATAALKKEKSQVAVLMSTMSFHDYPIKALTKI